MISIDTRRKLVLYSCEFDIGVAGCSLGPDRYLAWLEGRQHTDNSISLLDSPEYRGSEGLTQSEMVKSFGDWLWGLTDTTTIVLGGDHTATVGGVMAASKRHGGQPIGLIVLDAHVDAVPTDTEEDRWCNASFLGELSSNHPTVVVGVRTDIADHKSIEVVDTIGQALEHLSGLPLYLSVDIDVLDPTVAPGVSWPEHDGWALEDVMEAVRIVSCHPQFVGGDVVEFNPTMDHNNSLTCRVLHEVLGLFGLY